MIIRQSDIKTWARCPLAYAWQNVYGLPRLQGGSATFGTIIHDCTLWMETHRDANGIPDLRGAIDRFNYYWRTPSKLDITLVPDYYENGRSWVKFSEQGPVMLKNWWSIIQWDSNLVLAREHTFDVPIGDGHMLHGTVDKLEVRYHAPANGYVVMISDYKTNAKVPTYGYLEEDIQFSAYGYASLQPEFWANIPNGEQLFQDYADLPRWGEWVSLVQPRRMDAGVRTQRHFNRLTMAINALADSVAMRIFVPNISGETCRYCEFREQCGLPEIVED